jgi:integrase
LWDVEFDKITPNMCWNKIESLINQNVKRAYAGYIRNIFGYSFQQIPVVQGMSRTYDLPSQEELHGFIERSKYRLHLYLMMYAGLRLGEAAAAVPSQIKKEGPNYWINVDRAYSQDGKSFGSPKTIGKVMIPEWLALEVLAMKKEDYWIAGVPPKRITTACISLSAHGNRVKVNPHMLRHWFATDMVKRNVPANVIMKQMRHKTINTTMQIYAQVNNTDFIDALPQRPL